jgi:8-oxo-dGTP pyrophosphatase MutT (NUDIX family)
VTTVFTGKFVSVEHEEVRLPGGRMLMTEWVTRPDGVRVIAQRADGRVLISHEWRIELSARDHRLPGGKVEGVEPLVAAQQELREETGFVAGEWTPIGSTQALSMIRYRVHFFLARDLTYRPAHHDEGEDIRVKWIDLDTVIQMAYDGQIGEDASALQLLRLGAGRFG